MSDAKIVPKEVCKTCGKSKNYQFVHGTEHTWQHRFVGRMETQVEAAYRTGYDAGYERAMDKVHWGPGWD